jgi:signal transduction histidine kinase
VDRRGELWVGTAGAGVFRKHGDVFVPVRGAENVVFALHEDDLGRMWAGRLGGIVRLEGETFEPVESLERINATAIESGADGALWFADGIGGVVQWRDGEVIHFDPERGFPADMTLAVYDDPTGAVWIGAHLWGLTRYADGVPVSITTREGLCDDSVFSILEGPGGKLWMSSNLGVFAVEKSQLEAVARGEASRVDCRLFGEADGMRSAECNGGQSPTAWRDHSGRLWYATVDGVARVDPRQLTDVTPPQVVVEEMTSGGASIPRGEAGVELQLEPDQRDLAIRYTAMTLVDSKRARFRYRLEGLSTAWVDAGERRVAYYTSLPPTSYRFEVQARVPGSEWSEHSAIVEFSVRPRFFETRWFLALAILAFASLALAAHRARVGVLRRRQRQLQALVVERTRELEEVNNTLEQRVADGIEALRESDRMAAYGHLVAGVAHEVRHPIFALRAAAHLLTQKLASSDETKDELDILGRETERMSQLVDDLLELARPRELELTPCRADELIDEALASLAGLGEPHPKIVHESRGSDLRVLADRPAVIQVLVNLVDNACRHAVGARQVVVGAAPNETGDGVVLTVTDDGSGISVSDQAKIFEPFFSGTGGTGLGLAIASRLVREHQGRLSVQSTPGEETIFTILLQAADDEPQVR